MQYMTHPQHGATFAYDQSEIDRMEKVGWKKDKQPTADEIRAMKAGSRAAALRAELAEVEAVAEAPKKKRGPKPKAE